MDFAVTAGQSGVGAQRAAEDERAWSPEPPWVSAGPCWSLPGPCSVRAVPGGAGQGRAGGGACGGSGGSGPGSAGPRCCRSSARSHGRLCLRAAGRQQVRLHPRYGLGQHSGYPGLEDHRERSGSPGVGKAPGALGVSRGFGTARSAPGTPGLGKAVGSAPGLREPPGALREPRVRGKPPGVLGVSPGSGKPPGALREPRARENRRERPAHPGQRSAAGGTARVELILSVPWSLGQLVKGDALGVSTAGVSCK